MTAAKLPPPAAQEKDLLYAGHPDTGLQGLEEAEEH